MNFIGKVFHDLYIKHPKWIKGILLILFFTIIILLTCGILFLSNGGNIKLGTLSISHDISPKRDTIFVKEISHDTIEKKILVSSEKPFKTKQNVPTSNSSSANTNNGTIQNNVSGSGNTVNNSLTVTDEKQLLSRDQKAELIRLLNYTFSKDSFDKSAAIWIYSISDRHSMDLAQQIYQFLNINGYHLVGGIGFHQGYPMVHGVKINDLKADKRVNLYVGVIDY